VTSPSSPQSGDYVIPRQFWAWIGHSWTIAVVIWIAAISCGVAFTYRAVHWFDVPAYLTPERQRADGNAGHAQIDFGGQWVMGRMIATGNGRELYHRQRQWQVLHDSFPVSDESPLQQYESPLPRHWRTQARPDEDLQHDTTNLMNWFMGGEKEPVKEWKQVGGSVAAPFAQAPMGNPLLAVALEKAAADTVTPDVVAKVNEPVIGGPLYPPVHALFYAPIGMIDRPQQAYHIFQIFCALLVPFTGLGVKVLTRGRIWWSVATLGIFIYPGLRGGLDLGQNPTISLCIVIWGWALASRGYNIAGGMVWGLFAFKPVWAAAFFLVPFLMRRWRFCLVMVLTGAVLGALTLPFVGLHSWFEWLQIGGEASALYKVNTNWIHLSRDLQGIPRRFLIDFTKPEAERDTPLTNALAWGLWGAVFIPTVLIYLLRADRARPTGLGAGFLFLGAYLTCFHFMYYDELISFIALAVLFADPRPFFRAKPFAINPAAQQSESITSVLPAEREFPSAISPPKPLGARLLGYVSSFPLTIVMALFLMENSLSGMELEATVGIRYYATPATDGSTNAKIPRLKADTGINYPTTTLLVLALWGWCGWRLARGDERTTPSGELANPARKGGGSHALHPPPLRAGFITHRPCGRGSSPTALAGGVRYLAFSASSATPMSSARISDSPTNTACAPAAPSFSRSACVLIPLSLTTVRSAGIFGSNSSVCSSRVVNVRRSRLLMPIMGAPQSSTRGNCSASCSSTSVCNPSPTASR